MTVPIFSLARSLSAAMVPRLKESKIVQYAFMTGWLKTEEVPLQEIDLMGVVKQIGGSLLQRLQLGDPCYISLFLEFFPMYDVCYLLQTTD